MSGKNKKVHPWRVCPAGEHWVRTHTRSTAPVVHGYCRDDRSGKDQIQELEIDEIAARHFEKLKGPPASKTLGYAQGNKV